MDEHLRKHDRRPRAVFIIPDTPPEPSGDEMVDSPFQNLLRHGFHRPKVGTHEHEHQGRVAASQEGPHVENHDVKRAVGESAGEKAYTGKATPKNPKGYYERIVGPALEDRQKLARDRILRGGWTWEIATMAVEYTKQGAWYDRASKIWGVRCFVRDAEGLGEQCTDKDAIRGFLDANIYKFIAFHAMDKEFKVPEYLLQKARQRTHDWVLKYPWLLYFIREYQGLGVTSPVSLVQPYKAHGEVKTGDGSLSEPGGVHQGGTGYETTATLPAITPSSCVTGQDIKMPTIETSQPSMDKSDHMRKRKRTLEETEELNMEDLTPKVKSEPAEDGLAEALGNCHHDETTVVDMRGDEDEDRRQTKKRTLTVLFQGMRSDSDEESEQVHVYVPRTAKGVTIEFL